MARSFLYLYGADDHAADDREAVAVRRELGFFDEHDAAWDEYAALRELLAEANSFETAPAKKSVAKMKAPAKKSSAKKTPATKSPAKKKPTKKK